MKLKVMAYNIEFGFENNENINYHRLKLAQKLIDNERPDILGITEASKKVEYKKYFNYKNEYFTPWGPFGNLIMTNFPLHGSSIDLEDRVATRGSIAIKDKKLMVDLIHPSAFILDDKKIRSVKYLFESKIKPYILFGDFNAISRHDPYEYQNMLRGFSNLLQDQLFARKIVDNHMSFNFIDYIEKTGLIDSGIGSTFTIPTDSRSKDKSFATRMDYIFHSPELKCINHYVIKNSLTEQISDHYPIVSIFEI